MTHPTFAALFLVMVCFLLGYTSATESTTMVSVVRSKINAMHYIPQGFVHIGDDGVARSYDADGTVLDSFALTNAEIMAVGDSMIHNANFTNTEIQQYKDYITTVFEGVDGHDVSEYDMAHPSEAVLPYQLQGGRILQDTAETSEVEHANKIFERQLGFCHTMSCVNSASCLIILCGPCTGFAGVPGSLRCSMP